ncbi:hypothetical protein ACQ4PT_049693 [Festuca glaucescens]
MAAQGTTHAGVWDKVLLAVGMVSMEAVDTKVIRMVPSVGILCKENPAELQVMGIMQTIGMIIGGGQRNFSSNFHSNNRGGFGNNQQRWVNPNNAGRGGGFQQRYRGTGDGVAARGPIDADFLHQTVHAVVAAVTAAQKVPEGSNASLNNGTATAPSQGMSVVDPNVVLQQPTVPNKNVVEPQVVQGAAKGNEGPGPSKKKKDDKDACFRCKKPGHHIDDCITPFCDICESIHHVSSACHLLQAPKPTAIIHGYANEALMFFEVPCGAFKAKVENPKLAKVTVEGEVLTIPEIIEHMKRIVPSDKFHWEVFHYKDNIYRVKLPSKNEVQRLKNFGSYVCPQKETVMVFDLWSAVEEPLYMLPEVWVRVAGVPSDMRADYLSLWGIGSLFGKTLDVDMPFTRKNKLLRIKIGCLDRNLIPADSDVFIRKGFYKLRFEVETAHVAQEVNMSEANLDKDGGGDPNNGGGNIDGGNAMDMDAKGVEEDATSNNNGQDENISKSGVEGMQEQCQQVDEIQIGTLKVQLSPIDRSSSGLPRGRACAASTGASAGARCLLSNRSCGAAADSDKQRFGQSAASLDAVAATAEAPAIQGSQHELAKIAAGPLRANGDQETVLVGEAGNRRRSDTVPRTGSAVATPAVFTPPSPATLAQKIRPDTDAAITAVHGDCPNHCPADEPMMMPVLQDLGGFSAHGIDVGHGVFHNPNFIDKSFDVGLCMSSSFAQYVSHGNDVNNAGPTLDSFMVGPLDKSLEDALGSASLEKNGGRTSVDLQDTMRNASFMKSTGISLGNSTGEIGKSVKGLKMVEEERILTILEKKKSEIENREEGLETLVLSKVSTLCEDLIEDDDIPLDLDDHLEHLKPIVKE